MALAVARPQTGACPVSSKRAKGVSLAAKTCLPASSQRQMSNQGYQKHFFRGAHDLIRSSCIWNPMMVNEAFLSPWVVMLVEASQEGEAIRYLGDVSIPVRTTPLPPALEGPGYSSCHQVTSWTPWEGAALGAHLGPCYLQVRVLQVRHAAGAMPRVQPGPCEHPVTELCLGTMPSWHLRLSGSVDIEEGSFRGDIGRLISFRWNLCCGAL